MRIGICTLHQADSYGALLQAYALQQTLNGFGVESEFVTFPKTTRSGPERKIQSIPQAQAYVKLIKNALQKRNANFAKFRDESLVSSPLFTSEQGKEINDRYDFFIAGSDQVWNTKLPDTDFRFFLPFADDEKKYSYAASFGGHAAEESNQIWNSIGKFQRISLREKSDAEIVFSRTGKEPFVHIDPTLLLSQTSWNRLTHPVEGEPYIVVYMGFNNEEMLSYAKKYAGENHLKIRYITDCYHMKLGFDAWDAASVNDWLSFIKNASAVITNSFHGVVFSTLFEKRFCYFQLNGSACERNNRINQLAETLGFRQNHLNRIAEEPWDGITKQISLEKEKSLKYLKEIIDQFQK